MIGKALQKLLDEKDMNVNELSKMIHVSNQTLYSVIKRDNMKIDFEILLKICKALNVSADYFYSDYAEIINHNPSADNERLNEFIALCAQLNDDELDILENLIDSLLSKRNSQEN